MATLASSIKNKDEIQNEKYCKSYYKKNIEKSGFFKALILKEK